MTNSSCHLILLKRRRRPACAGTTCAIHGKRAEGAALSNSGIVIKALSASDRSLISAFERVAEQAAEHETALIIVNTPNAARHFSRRVTALNIQAHRA